MARKFVLKARQGAGAVDFSGELNPEQLQVVTAGGGPMLVVAGAGTGKTRALTYRLAYLVSQGVDPVRILLVTFTNRAAREMLNRVELLVKQQTRQLWGGTFHHIANRLLRQYGTKVGVSPDFSILDREDSRDLMGTCVADVGIATKERRFPQKNVLVAINSFVQNTLEPLETVLGRRYPMFANDVEGIEKVLVQYAARKQQRQLLDYDDLLAYWLRLLVEHEDVRTVLAEKFVHVLVDEYQDTNAIQGQLVDLLASRHRNLTVVGDDAQSIYSFRGANFENIITFSERYPEAVSYRLETNYRSTPEILALANANIACNVRRLPKDLHAVRPGGLRPAVVCCHDHFVQAQFVGEYILHLLDEGRRLNDVAVLYRSHWHSLELQLDLQRRNIPFQVRGGLRFFEQAHIKDVVCFLRLLHNSRDELAWTRVLKMLPRVGPAISRRFWRYVEPFDSPIEEACGEAALQLFPQSARPFYENLVGLLGEVSQLNSPADIIEKVLEGFYEDYLMTRYDGASLRREDIRGLANYAGQYETLETFLAEVALAGEFSGETVVNGPDEQEFVTLSTVHQAKGLEWPVVFVPWLADGRFPTDLAMNSEADLEEERRVFHVALTRAQDELYLVTPQVYHSRGGGVVMMKASRFLTELDGQLCEPLELEESRGPGPAALEGAVDGQAAGKQLPAARAEAGRKKGQPKEHG